MATKSKLLFGGKSRFYFFDRNGNELVDHELNGVAMSGTGAAVCDNGRLANKEPNFDIWKDSKGRIARLSIKGATKDYLGREITVDDFGGEPVLVKDWFGGRAEMFWLIGESDAEKIAHVNSLNFKGTNDATS